VAGPPAGNVAGDRETGRADDIFASATAAGSGSGVTSSVRHHGRKPGAQAAASLRVSSPASHLMLGGSHATPRSERTKRRLEGTPLPRAQTSGHGRSRSSGRRRCRRSAPAAKRVFNQDGTRQDGARPASRWGNAGRSMLPAPRSKPVTRASRLVAQIAPSVALGFGLRILAAGPAVANITPLMGGYVRQSQCFIGIGVRSVAFGQDREDLEN
jgi:hypothetical protein